MPRQAVLFLIEVSAFDDFRVPVPNADDPLTDKPRAQQEWAAYYAAHLASTRGPHWKRRAWGEIPASTWGGPTRLRPYDPAYFEKSLLYDTGREVDRACIP